LINGKGSFDCDSVELDDDDNCSSDSPLPHFKFEPGKRYRLRLINAGAISNIRFSIDNHKLTIIEVFAINAYTVKCDHNSEISVGFQADGVPMKKYTVDRLSLHVAQRYSVIVEANQEPQNYYMRAELDKECFHGDAELLAEYPPALAEVRYEGGDDTFEGSIAAKDTLPHCADMNGESLVNYYPISAPRYDDSVVVRVRFGRNGTRLRGFLNNQTYVHDSTRPTMMNWWSGQTNINSVNFVYVIDKPKVIQVVIQGGVNGGEHPFHLVL
jgi:FtsP/CotA-like multicopper oxidase with cupredoxin domain